MKFRSSPRDLKTPPYVTPEPEVTHRKLSFLPLPSSQEQQPTTKSTLRFIVLATDGLWDCLSSSEVVSLVGGHLSGLKGIVPKSVLASTTIMTESSAGVEGKEKKSSRDQLEGNWAFLDENVGSHVIRNAFGGGDELALRKKVSIPPPVARSFRDDITVTVVWWHDGRQDSTQMKAKL
jgi:pyruvate dehydrogenase phosphatase